MITVTTDKMDYSINISGHAGYAEKGKDIVCSAVSILYYALSEALTQHKSELLMFDLHESDGNAVIRCCPQEGYAHVIDALYEVFKTGIRLLHEHYPNNVLIIEKG